MKSQRVLLMASVVLLTLVLTTNGAGAQGPTGTQPRAPRTALGTAFTYQGQLKQSGNPVNGVTCDFQFGLYDALTGPTQIGTTQTASALVTNGYFTISSLDFGSGAFNGDARWLNIQVRCPTGSGSYTPLTPRQPLTPAPMALALPGLYTQQNATSPNLIGGYSGNWVTGGVVGATISGGGESAYQNLVTDDYGVVGGGAGNQAGDIAGPHTNASFATVGGGGINTANAAGATVGGGYENTASSQDATVGGGYSNTASGNGAFVGGGGYDGINENGNQAVGNASTIGGGLGNSIPVTGNHATVGGGRGNTASGNYATVGGGEFNNASGAAATIPGGFNNDADGNYSFAAGDFAEAYHQGAFVWADSQGMPFASTAQNQFLIRAGGGVGIGTNSPVTTLEVAGLADSYHTLAIRGTNTANRRTSLFFESTPGGVPTGEWELGTDMNQNSGHDLFLWDNVANAIRLSIDAAGEVAIPVLGSAGSTPLCRNASNQISTCSSSLRYKNNVANLNLGLDTLAQLRPVTFDWKDTGEPDLGFVAEEVNQVTPLLTTRNAQGQIEGVKYDRVSAVLVKAVQEQQQEIAELKSQVTAQQKQIDALDARLTALEHGTVASPSPLAGLANNAWLAGTLLIAAVLIGQRRFGGGR